MPSSKRTSSHHQTSHSSHHPQTQSQNLKAAPVGHDTDSMPQNSITVASRTVPVRARSISSSSTTSPLSSSHSSPAVPTTAKSPVQVAATELSKSINNTATSPAATANTNSLESNGNSASLTSNPTAGRQKPQTVTSYDMSSNLEEITMRQLEEDISAYQHDEAFCLAQLEEPDLTPQETRTLQLRILDLGHQVRHCRHRIETIQFQLRKIKPVALGLRPAYNGLGAPLVPASSAPTNGTSVNGPGTKVHVNIKHPSSSGAAGGYIVKRPGAAATPSTGHKRTAESEEADGDVTSGESKKIKTGSSPTPPAVDYEMHIDGGAGVDNVNTALQRLGFWKCRLCSSPKYLLAGSGRTPAAPCKWPLKDISKMITHFTEMHVEHSASERCVELGSALAKNRGPFEYWLRRTRAQNIGDGTMLDECIAHLLQGEMPQLLRRHSRAAASMQQD